MEIPTSKLEWALWLASKGFSILQLKPDSKEPVGGFGWLKTHTTDPDTIKAWYAEQPNRNFGVCAGPNNVIIDLDNKPHEGKHGESFFFELQQENGFVEDTFSVRSPSGGLHLYLKTYKPLGNAHRFGKTSGVDVRGAHGYVVGPGCTLGNKSYVVENFTGNFAETPDWLTEKYLLGKRERKENATDPLFPWDEPENIAKAESYLKTHPPAIQGRNGNEYTYDTACMIRDFGVSEDMCAQLMFTTGWNDRCLPPWGWDELSDVVEHSYRYGQNRPGEKADFIGMYERLNGDVAITEAHEAGIDDNTAIKFYSPSEFLARGKRREYVIPGWLLAHGFTALNATRSMGKSTILLDLACRIACGLDWQGIRIKDGYVAVYICGEDDEGLETNMSAWCRYHKREIPDDSMIVTDTIPDIKSAIDTEKWVRSIVDKLNGRKAVIILDTWQRATTTAKQNDDQDMNLCVHHAEVLARSVNGPIIIASHPPKHNDRTIHGSAIIENATSAIWRLDEDSVGRRLSVDRIKGPGYGNYRLFEFKTVELDTFDSFEKREMGLVPVKKGGSEDEGTLEHKEKFDREREAWAWIVRGVLTLEDAPGTTRMSSPTAANVANKIAVLMKEDSFIQEFGVRAMDAGINGFSFSSINRAFADYLYKDPFNFTDKKLKLYVEKRGNSNAFKMTIEGDTK